MLQDRQDNNHEQRSLRKYSRQLKLFEVLTCMFFIFWRAKESFQLKNLLLSRSGYLPKNPILSLTKKHWMHYLHSNPSTSQCIAKRITSNRQWNTSIKGSQSYISMSNLFHMTMTPNTRPNRKPYEGSTKWWKAIKTQGAKTTTSQTNTSTIKTTTTNCDSIVTTISNQTKT